VPCDARSARAASCSAWGWSAARTRWSCTSCSSGTTPGGRVFVDGLLHTAASGLLAFGAARLRADPRRLIGPTDGRVLAAGCSSAWGSDPHDRTAPAQLPRPHPVRERAETILPRDLASNEAALALLVAGSLLRRRAAERPVMDRPSACRSAPSSRQHGMPSPPGLVADASRRAAGAAPAQRPTRRRSARTPKRRRRRSLAEERHGAATGPVRRSGACDPVEGTPETGRGDVVDRLGRLLLVESPLEQGTPGPVDVDAARDAARRPIGAHGRRASVGGGAPAGNGSPEATPVGRGSPAAAPSSVISRALRPPAVTYDQAHCVSTCRRFANPTR
jgi:hypothetical protein